MGDLKELVTGGKNYQLTVGFYPFAELFSPFCKDDPVKAAIEDADRELASEDDLFDGGEMGTKFPEAGPADVQVMSYPRVIDVMGDELINAWVYQL